MRYNKRRLRKQKSNLNDLSMTPLIDTALTLLIIFMIATPMIHNAIKVTLPRGNAQEDTHNQSNELIVFIDKHGDFYIDKIKTEKTKFIDRIKEIIGNNQEKTVYVHADTAVSYGIVVELVDDIKKFVGGIKHVALATQKHSQTTSSMG